MRTLSQSLIAFLLNRMIHRCMCLNLKLSAISVSISVDLVLSAPQIQSQCNACLYIIIYRCLCLNLNLSAISVSISVNRVSPISISVQTLPRSWSNVSRLRLNLNLKYKLCPNLDISCLACGLISVSVQSLSLSRSIVSRLCLNPDRRFHLLYLLQIKNSHIYLCLSLPLL